MFKKTKALFIKIALIFFGIFVSFLLIELSLRLFFKQNYSPRIVKFKNHQETWGTIYYESDYENGYVNYQYCYSSDYKGFFDKNDCVPTTLNLLGFRGPLFEFERKEETYRIVFLGDSFTFGEGVFFEKTYPKRLENLLSTRTINGKKIEVFNLAISGSWTEDEIKTYIQFGQKLKPNLVVLQWHPNDFPSSTLTRDHERSISGNYIAAFNPPEIVKRFALGRFIWHTIKTKQVSNQIMQLTPLELVLGQESFSQIFELKQLISNDGADFVLLIFPELIKFNHYPYSQLSDSLKEFCASKKIVFIDLLPPLSQHQDKDLWVHPSDHHPNDIAHEIAAQSIYDYLNKRYLDH